MNYKLFSKILVFAILFNSCKEQPDAGLVEKLKFLHQTLESTNSILIRDNYQICRKVELDITNPFTSSKASYVKPKIDLIVKRSDIVLDYIYSIKKNFTYNNFTSADSLSERSVVAYLKKNTSRFDDLYKQLIELKSDLLKIDTNLANQFKSMEIIPEKISGKKINQDFYYDFFFRDKNLIEVQVNLSQIENRVLLFKNALITFLSFSYSNDALIIDDFYNVLINQTKDQVKPGGEFFIYAGIGSFSTRVNSKIQIAGISRSIDAANGLTSVKIKAPKIPGTYDVPIVVEYIDFDSNKVTKSFTVKYSVVQ